MRMEGAFHAIRSKPNPAEAIMKEHSLPGRTTRSDSHPTQKLHPLSPMNPLPHTRRTFLRSSSLAAAALAAPRALHAQNAEAFGLLVTDFSHSYLRWTLDTKVKPPKTVSKPLPMTLNRVRMPVEATVKLKRETTGAEVFYALGAECRTEQVWVKRDVWHDPNAGMWMIGGEKHCLIEKHWARGFRGRAASAEARRTARAAPD